MTTTSSTPIKPATAPTPALGAAIPNLWPDDIGETSLTAPLSIIQAQAHNLAQRTGGLVVGAVDTVTERASSFVHTFTIIAPALSNYVARIFRVKHGVHFYPLEVITEIDGPNFRAASQDDFLRALGEIFASAPLKKMVHSLIAQSRVTSPANPPHPAHPAHPKLPAHPSPAPHPSQK